MKGVVKATDLLGLAVYDVEGELVGHVHDLRFDPPPGGGCVGYRLSGFACGGRFALGHRLGYQDHEMAGPWPLNSLFRRWARRARVVEWQDVVGIEPTRIDIARRRADLRSAVTDDQ